MFPRLWGFWLVELCHVANFSLFVKGSSYFKGRFVRDYYRTEVYYKLSTIFYYISLLYVYKYGLRPRITWGGSANSYIVDALYYSIKKKTRGGIFRSPAGIRHKENIEPGKEKENIDPRKEKEKKSSIPINFTQKSSYIRTFYSPIACSQWFFDTQ